MNYRKRWGVLVLAALSAFIMSGQVWEQIESSGSDDLLCLLVKKAGSPSVSNASVNVTHSVATKTDLPTDGQIITGGVTTSLEDGGHFLPKIITGGVASLSDGGSLGIMEMIDGAGDFPGLVVTI